MKRLSLRSLAILSLGGYSLLACWFPLRSNLHASPLPDIFSFSPSLWEGLLYALWLGLLFVLYGLAYRWLQNTSALPSAGWLFLTAALFCLPLLFTFPFNATDIYRYFIRGRITSHYQLSPFVYPPSAFPADPFVVLAGEWDDATSPYGPLWELLAAGLANLSGDRLQLALLLFKGLGASLHLAIGVLIWLILGRDRTTPGQRLSRTLLWLWNPALLLIFVADGHNDALMLFWLLAGTFLLWRGRESSRYLLWATAGLLVMGLALLSKFIGLLPLPFFFLYAVRRLPHWRARLTLVALCGLGGAVIAYLLFWPFLRLDAVTEGSFWQLVQRLFEEASTSGGFSPAVLLILVARQFGLELGLRNLARVGDLLLAAGGLFLWWRGFRGRSPLRSTADIFVVYVFQALNFRIWYTAWPFAWLLLDQNRNHWTPVLLFLLNAQLSVVIYGHLQKLVLLNTFASHLIGVSMVFGLPLLLAYSEWKREKHG